jgi:hypothetical protein
MKIKLKIESVMVSTVHDVSFVFQCRPIKISNANLIHEYL